MRILVIEDERAYARELSRHLEREGYEVSVASTAAEGLQLAQEVSPDLVLLDVRLPDMDGWQVCELLRESHDMGIIAVSAYGQESLVDRVLRSGGDDYILKPVGMRELMARIRALLRRTKQSQPRAWTYHDGYLYIDSLRRLVERDGERVDLSHVEFKVLNCLLEHRNQVVSRQELVAEVWGEDDEEGRDQYVSLYISYLRKKLERDPRDPRYLRTKRGVGYWFCTQDGLEPILEEEDAQDDEQ